MARARRAATTASKQSGSNGGGFTCPECGKTFTRAASLGAHRNRAHGVSGESKRRNRKRSGQPTGAQTPARRGGARTGAAAAAGSKVNRDALLQTLFPTGLPAREEVIRRANAWLDEAESLAKSR